MTIHKTNAAKVNTSQFSFNQWIHAQVNEIIIFDVLITTINMNKWVKEWINITITINTYIYKSTTRKTNLYSNLLFWQSCIYKRWTHILLSSQHSCGNSAADHHAHLHLSLPSITTLIAAVRLESDHEWERDIEAVLAWVNRKDEEDHDDAPWATQPRSKSRRTCGIIWLSLCLLSMSTNTCKTFEQSKTTKDY